MREIKFRAFWWTLFSNKYDVSFDICKWDTMSPEGYNAKFMYNGKRDEEWTYIFELLWV